MDIRGFKGEREVEDNLEKDGCERKKWGKLEELWNVF